MKQANNKLKKINYCVSKEYDNYRLDKLIKKLQPQWSKVYILKLIRKKNIKVNEVKTNPSYHLKINDVVSYFGLENPYAKNNVEFELKQIKNLPKLNVIYEDDFIIIVNKPIKVSVQSTVNCIYDNMNNRLLNYLQFDAKSLAFKPIFIHRLDMNTTGLLIGAKTYKTYINLINAFKQKKITKIYHALVWNPFNEIKKEIKNYLIKNSKNNISKVVHHQIENAKFAHTSVECLKNFEHQSYVKIILHTGRTHQIRVHLNYEQHPICGDRKYGINSKNNFFPTPALIASELIFDSLICVNELSGLKNKKIKINYFWFLKSEYILN